MKISFDLEKTSDRRGLLTGSISPLLFLELAKQRGEPSSSQRLSSRAQMGLLIAPTGPQRGPNIGEAVSERPEH